MPPPPSRPTPTPLPAGVSLGAPHAKTQSVSLVRVLADPSSVDRKAITVGGYLDFDGDDNYSLCLHQDDADHGVRTNCVALVVANTRAMRDLALHYVTVAGVVRLRQSVGFSFTDFAIEDVRRVDPSARRSMDVVELH